MLKTYIGTKIIQAEPALKEGETRTLGYRVIYPDGYVSWSPKAVFEEVYREITGAEASISCAAPD